MSLRNVFIIAASLALVSPVAAQAQGADAKVESLKASLAASQAALRHYSWIETTTVTYNGEVKAVRQASVSYGPDDFLVFGRETKGLPEELLKANLDHCVRLPMRNCEGARSLNLSNSAAIVIYEALRQQGYPNLA